MFRIKRTKELKLAGLKPTCSVHYAYAVAKAGNVERWLPLVDHAAKFDAETVARVKAHYAGKANAGVLSFEEVVEPKPAVKPEPVKLLEPKPVQESAKPAATVEPPKEPEPEPKPARNRHHKAGH